MHPDEDRENLEVSVVMPCLNEADTLTSCIQKAQTAIRGHDLRAEIVVADNGSTDESAEIAAKLGARVVHAKERGYGSALMAGIAQTRSRFIIMGDADDSYDFLDIPRFVEKLREGYDLVQGCRLPSGGGTVLHGAMPSLHRWLGNPALSKLARIWFGVPINDLYCGLRGFTRELYDRLALQCTGMEFAAEMIIKASLFNAKMTEIPVILHPDGRIAHRPHLRTFRDGWRTLRFFLMYSPRWLFLIPGLILAVASAAAGGILLAGPVEIGGVGFDTNTLLVCAMGILVGFKLVTFAMFNQLFALSEGLLPEDPQFSRLFRIFTLERGILAGSAMVLTGFALLGWGIVYWERHDFGPLSYPDSLRLVIPGVTALTLGVEIIFSSFFMSILGLNRK